MTDSAKISLLIPYFNEPNGLMNSIKSIGYAREINIVIVDDGSELKFDEKQLTRNAPNQYEFHFLCNNENMGIEGALNNGLLYIKKHLPSCEYVARLDCGDICVNQRIEKQEGFLDNNKAVHLVGSWVQMVDKKGEELFMMKFPTDHATIIKRMYINNMICNGASMFRIKPITDNVGTYPTRYKAAEDHAYFLEIAKRFEVANIPEVLYHYEIDPNSISSKKRRQQVLSRIKLIFDNFYFGFYPIYGLLRNLVLLTLSREAMTKIKLVLFDKK